VAQRVVQAAKKEAADHRWACVIAVVDAEGLLVTMVRMDNAAVPAGVELPAAITAHGFVMMTGGVPIVADGHIVGAIGASSDTPHHDVQVANAGVAALTQ
jgi:glc operon protein GlcG